MKARLAGEALKWLFKNQNAAEIAFRVVPDMGFGILEGVLTPGDIGDKVIAGAGTAIGGVTGGALLGKLGGKSQLLTQGLDLAGSVGGDFAGRFLGEQAQKGKDLAMGGTGQTDYERLNQEQSELFAEQIRTQILSELGLLPGGAQSYLADASTGQVVA